MTSSEKETVAAFLDLAGDYLGDGYRKSREPLIYEDDAPAPAESKEGTGLPLAYLIEEPDGAFEAAESANSDDSLGKLNAEIAACKKCALAGGRTFAVPGEGSSRPFVMVVGEGPGADEDKAGRPFVGRAGQLLDRMLASIGLSRETNCFIANTVKCRPPENRDPAPEETAACSSFLERQIRLLRPVLILCAGRVAAQSLLKTREGINALRGKFAELKTRDGLAIPVLPTFHPSAVLRDETLKRPAWEDLKLLKAKLSSVRGEGENVPSGEE